MLPAVLRGHGRLGGLRAVRQQVHLDRLRPHAILVFVVIPGLGDAHAGLFGCVGVGDGEAIGHRPGILRGIARDFVLRHGVGDLNAILVLVQVLPGHRQRRARGIRRDGPVIVIAHRRDRAVAHLFVQVQRHLGAQAVLVVAVAPRLRGAHVHLLRRVRVGDREAIGRVSGNSHRILGSVQRDLVIGRALLGHCIGDLHALLILRQVLPGDGQAFTRRRLGDRLLRAFNGHAP